MHQVVISFHCIFCGAVMKQHPKEYNYLTHFCNSPFWDSELNKFTTGTRLFDKVDMMRFIPKIEQDKYGYNF